MDLMINSRTCFVTDLDDTLYFEIDFLKSAFRSISKNFFAEMEAEIYDEMIKIYMNEGNVFIHLINKYPEKSIELTDFLECYRFHKPSIFLRPGILSLLTKIQQKQGVLGLITDGRSSTQRNKIEALGIESFFDDIIISEEFGTEKPSVENFMFFMNKYPKFNFIYLGDNILKDFITPRKMGWLCIGIKKSEKEIKRNYPKLSNSYLPHFFINSPDDIKII